MVVGKCRLGRFLSLCSLIMDYTKAQLVEALCAEYDYLCHDDFNPETDPTLDEYCEMLEKMSIEELIEETSTDEHFTLEEFMENHGWYINDCKSNKEWDKASCLPSR